MSEILLLNGPNLNLLGTREPEHYGASTLAQIEQSAQHQASTAGFEMDYFQSNSESQLIERIHRCVKDDCRIILFNPAAFTHTSIALRDALLAVAIPFIEIHLSDPKTREAFRHQSFFSDVALHVFSGFGAESYSKAVNAAIEWLNQIN